MTDDAPVDRGRIYPELPPYAWRWIGRCEHGFHHNPSPHACDFGNHDECPFWAEVIADAVKSPTDLV